jgi:hypothetical protein
MSRPKIISFICILGFISVVLSFPQVFSPSVKKIGMFAPALFGSVIAFQFISFVGLWYFKQWGARFFVISVFLRLYFHLLFFISPGFGFYFALFLLLFSLVFILKYFRQMNPNF